MEDVIIYGVDNSTKRLEIEYLLDSDKYRILAYSDSFHHYKYWGGRPFIPIEDIGRCECKYIIVACDSTEVYSEIKSNLEKNGVPADKIIRHYFFKFSHRLMNYYLDELFTQSPLPYEGIILGNSYALRGINTSCLSKCFCNLGWHGLDMYYSYKLLKYLKQTSPSKMADIKYVILVFPYYFFNYDMSVSLYQIQTGQIWALSHLEDWHNIYKLPEFREYRRMYLINKELFGKNVNRNSLSAWSGNDNLVFNWREEKEHKLSHTWSCIHTATIQENIAVFHELLEFIMENNIKPILLITPYHHLFHEKYPAEIAEMKDKYYELLKEEELCKEIRVVDKFCCDMSYDDKYWADMTHLNSVGADALSLLLDKEFKESYY